MEEADGSGADEPLAVLEDGEPVSWEVKKVLDKRRNDVTGGIEYYIEWKNWDGPATWEPEENCDCTALIKKFEKERAKGGKRESHPPSRSQSRTPARRLQSKGASSSQKSAHSAGFNSRERSSTQPSELAVDDDSPTPSTSKTNTSNKLGGSASAPTNKNRRRSARVRESSQRRILDEITIDDDDDDEDNHPEVVELEKQARNARPKKPASSDESVQEYSQKNKKKKKTIRSRPLIDSSSATPMSGASVTPMSDQDHQDDDDTHHSDSTNDDISDDNNHKPTTPATKGFPRAKTPEHSADCCQSPCAEVQPPLTSHEYEAEMRKRKLVLKDIIGAVNSKEILLIVKWHGTASLEKVPLQVLRRFHCQDILDFLLEKIKWKQ